MKKTLITLACAAMFSTANVQAAGGSSSASGSGGHSDGMYTLGIEGAITLANSNAVGSTSATKFTGGLYLDWRLADMWHFRPELLYQALSPDFIALPLMVSAKFEVGPMFRPYVFLGPEVSFRIGSAVGVKTLNLAISGGAGVEFLITDQFTLGANGRYSFGLLNLADTAVLGAGADFKTRNIVILATVGYRM